MNEPDNVSFPHRLRRGFTDSVTGAIIASRGSRFPPPLLGSKQGVNALPGWIFLAAVCCRCVGLCQNRGCSLHLLHSDAGCPISVLALCSVSSPSNAASLRSQPEPLFPDQHSRKQCVCSRISAASRAGSRCGLTGHMWHLCYPPPLFLIIVWLLYTVTVSLSSLKHVFKCHQVACWDYES